MRLHYETYHRNYVNTLNAIFPVIDNDLSEYKKFKILFANKEHMKSLAQTLKYAFNGNLNH